MLPHPHVALSEFTRNNRITLSVVGIFNPEHVIWEKFTKPSMYLQQRGCGRGISANVAAINPLLNSYMGLSLKLQVSLLRVGAVVTFERLFYIDRVGVMPLYEVAVVAIHRTHEISKGGQ